MLLLFMSCVCMSCVEIFNDGKLYLVKKATATTMLWLPWCIKFSQFNYSLILSFPCLEQVEPGKKKWMTIAPSIFLMIVKASWAVRALSKRERSKRWGAVRSIQVGKSCKKVSEDFTLSWRLQIFKILLKFLGASKHLCKRVCPSIRRSVVRPVSPPHLWRFWRSLENCVASIGSCLMHQCTKPP